MQTSNSLKSKRHKTRKNCRAAQISEKGTKSGGGFHFTYQSGIQYINDTKLTT